jgi:glutamine synthetase
MSRTLILEKMLAKEPCVSARKREPLAQEFGCLTFHKALMEKRMSKKVYAHLCEAMDGRCAIDFAYADEIAQAMKEWATEHGATYFCHWFQPLTGHAAEKHDAFIDWKSPDLLIEKFSGKQLVRGEPDASSFPSGGLRKTAAARGYTVWDPSSVAFLWRSGGSTTLCIPSIFFSWSGQALDMKIPLLRSDAKINQAALRLLHFLDIEADRVYSTLGCEQEYFLIDRVFVALRPDLSIGGRTVLGAASPKGQELEDHYFGAMKEKAIAFMNELEAEALSLGIPLKTRHCEVAPNQFEFAPLFERAVHAVDHNMLLMELMRKIAKRHQLTCLLHEKPFARINGSGKHCNWSLSTDRGLNLLDPTQEPHNSLLFLLVVAATLKAVHKHASLLRASIASAGNDHRLGGNEAPPVIISVHMGHALETLLNNIAEDRAHKSHWGASLDLGIPLLPKLALDETDRNRTSPFAFTGNKFEFRAVGASANPALPITVLNVIVAESLQEILDEIEKRLTNKKAKEKVAMEVVRSTLKQAHPILFSGDNYAEAWKQEAKKRKLPCINRSAHAFEAFLTKSSLHAFESVLSKEELTSRVEVMEERYVKEIQIEARLLIEMFRTQILPPALEYQKLIAKSYHAIKSEKGLGKAQHAVLKKLATLIDQSIQEVDAVESALTKAASSTAKLSAHSFCEQVAPQCEKARRSIDALEEIVDDRLWTLPKYREMLTTA